MTASTRFISSWVRNWITRERARASFAGSGARHKLDRIALLLPKRGGTPTGSGGSCRSRTNCVAQPESSINLHARRLVRPIGRISQSLDVARHAGVEDDLAGD